MPDGAGEHPHHHWHPHLGWRVLLGVAVVLVLLAGAGVVLYNSREEPEARSTEEAVEQFRGQDTGTTAPESPLVPPPGVYRYLGSGVEDTSFPPLTEQHGPELPGTVTLDPEPGCWTLRIDFNTNHWQTWRFCSGPGTLDNGGGTSFSRRDLGAMVIDNETTFVCDPPAPWRWPDPTEGEGRDGSCVGSSTAMDGTTTSAGPTRYLGEEDVEVDGVTRRAVHVRVEHLLSGAQTGTERVDWWLDAETNLPLRNDRELVIDTAIALSTIRYTETGEFTLTALAPRT